MRRTPLYSLPGGGGEGGDESLDDAIDIFDGVLSYKDQVDNGDDNKTVDKQAH